MKYQIILLIILLLVGCQNQQEVTLTPEATAVAIPTATIPPQPLPTNTTTAIPPTSQIEAPVVPATIDKLSDYPPNDTPYKMLNGDYWLVHTLDGHLIAFAPLSPEYGEQITVDECRFEWHEANHRFADPCSGDEWELNGRLNLAHSGESWSNRDLDQYAIVVQEGTIFVQMDRLVKGQPLDEPPLAVATQFGVTLTAVTTDFTPTTTSIDTLGQVDPIWGMDASAFPPQQALTSPTFPDSLIDNQGRSISPSSREADFAIFDPRTGGLQQMMHNDWEAIAPDASVITATLMVDLSNLHREVVLQPDWSNHQEGDAWAVDIPLEIGYAAARINQIEWLETTADGRARLRLTVINASPEGINLYCLHLDADDPWQRTCANFDDELTYTIVALPGEPVALHLRAGLELLTPFQLVLNDATPAPSPTPATTPPSSLPITEPFRNDQVLWFAQDDALWRTDVHGVNVSQLSPDGFLDMNREEVIYHDTQPRLSPDGRYVAQLTNPDTTRILDLGSGQQITIPGAWEVAWSPDSRTLAYTPLTRDDSQSLWLADAVTGNVTELVGSEKLTGDGRIHNIAWSPDGSQIAFDCCFTPREPYDGFSDGLIQIVNVATGEVIPVADTWLGIASGAPPFCWTEEGSVTTEIEWWMGSCARDFFPESRISNLLAQWEANFDDNGDWQSTRIFVTNVVDDQLVWGRTLPLQSYVVMAWSPDGRYLFVDDQAADSPIWRISADGSEVVELLPGSTLLGIVPQWETLSPLPPTISPDGQWQVTSHVSDTVLPEEGEAEQFPNGKYHVEMIVARTDGSQSWTAVNEWRGYGLGWTFPQPVRWSADGRSFYFVNVPVPDGCSVFVNGGDLWRLNLSSGEVTEVAPTIGLVMDLSPDETQLAVNASYGRGFLIRDLTNGTELSVPLPRPTDDWQMGGLQWSPDGRHLLLIQVLNPCSLNPKTAFVRLDMDSLAATTILESDERHFTLLKWVNEGEVQLLDKDGHIWYLEVFSGEMAQSQ